jgi:hypothetical protein
MFYVFRSNFPSEFYIDIFIVNPPTLQRIFLLISCVGSVTIHEFWISDYDLYITVTNTLRSFVTVLTSLLSMISSGGQFTFSAPPNCPHGSATATVDCLTHSTNSQLLQVTIMLRTTIRRPVSVSCTNLGPMIYLFLLLSDSCGLVDERRPY